LLQQPEAARFSSDGTAKPDNQIYTWFREADSFFQYHLPLRDEAHDYFEGRHFSEEDMEILEERGQPKTVINKTRVSIELVMGIYDKTRMDTVMLPRGTKDDDWVTAQGLSAGSKYIEDTNASNHAMRQQFFDVLVSGEGWMETGLSQDPTREEIEESYADWREMRRDPRATRLDYDDARYHFRVKWFDLDEAKARMPEHKEKLESVAGESALLNHLTGSQNIAGEDDYLSVPEMYDVGNNGWRIDDWLDTKQNRVLLLECWYYKWDRADFIKDRRTGRVVEFDPKNMNEATKTLLMGGVSGQLPVEILRNRPIRRCRQAILAGPYVLEDEPSPYQHNRIPFQPCWGWIDSSTGAPTGLVAALKDPQDAANKALSKLILSLSTNQVLAEENAGNHDILRKEASKPDGYLIVARNALREQRFQLNRNAVEASAHQAVFEMFNRVASDMAGGLELSGQASNADSGRAIALRQEQGYTTLSTIFENFRRAKRRFVEMRLSNMQQFWTDEKFIRITETNDPDRREMMVLNERQPDGTIRNDITSIKCDVVIDEQTARASVRQQFADRLMDFLQRMPDPMIAMSMMDIVVDMYDLPDRPVIKQRIQQAMAMVGMAQQQQATGDTAKTAPGGPPAGAAPGGEGAGFGPEVMARMAQADAGPAVNNLGR
jgi:hypothetical protein